MFPLPSQPQARRHAFRYTSYGYLYTRIFGAPPEKDSDLLEEVLDTLEDLFGIQEDTPEYEEARDEATGALRDLRRA